MTNIDVNNQIMRLKKELIVLIKKTGSNPSFDENYKLDSMDLLCNKPIRQKQYVLNYCNTIKNSYGISDSYANPRYLFDDDTCLLVQNFVNDILTYIYLNLIVDKFGIKVNVNYVDIVVSLFNKLIVNDFKDNLMFINNDVLYSIFRRMNRFNNADNNDASENLENITSYLVSKYKGNKAENIIDIMLSDINDYRNNFKVGGYVK